MNRLFEILDELEPSRKVVLAVVLPLIVLGAYYFIVLTPRLRHTTEIRSNIETMIEDRSRKITEASQMAERQREVASLDQQLKVAIRRLPDQKEIPELLSSISNLGRDAGLDILVFRQKPEGYQEFYAEVPVEMQVLGGYHQVAAFVDQVGKLDRIVNVSSIALEEPKVTDDELLLKASAQVTTFRFLSEPERQRLIKEKKIKGEEQR